LKELNWEAFSDYLVFGWDKHPTETVKKALESAFAGFAQKPRFAVEYWIAIDD